MLITLIKNTIKLIIIALPWSDYEVLLLKIIFNVLNTYKKNKENEKKNTPKFLASAIRQKIKDIQIK